MTFRDTDRILEHVGEGEVALSPCCHLTESRSCDTVLGNDSPFSTPSKLLSLHSTQCLLSSTKIQESTADLKLFILGYFLKFVFKFAIEELTLEPVR